MPSNIQTVEIDTRTILKRHPDIEREKALAVKDLLSLGHIIFKENGHLQPPYHLILSMNNRRLILLFKNENKTAEETLTFSLKPYRRLIKDYFLICESYQQCLHQNDNMRLQTIDMARRGIHDEGACVLSERLSKAIEIDHETARALFTLICILHIGAHKPW
jgi:uncharacterized protein (UPF0262 family)